MDVSLIEFMESQLKQVFMPIYALFKHNPANSQSLNSILSVLYPELSILFKFRKLSLRLEVKELTAALRS